MENLEERRLLAITPFISEFMADNDNALTLPDGTSPGWIEVANPSPSEVNLEGYYLTDEAYDPLNPNPDALRKWRIPAVAVPAGGYQLFYASGLDKDVPGSPRQLHTNFELANSGEYLALVWPDGMTVLSEFEPQYPRQVTDVSYGIALDYQTTTLIGPSSPVRAIVPADGTLGSNWLQPDFPDGTWLSGTSGVGFDIGTSPPRISGFTVRMADVSGPDFGDVATAERLLVSPPPGGYTMQSDNTRDYPVLNFGDMQNFGSDQLLPNGRAVDEQYVLRATTDVFIPQGTWSFNVGSDDGFKLSLPGAVFTNKSNDSGLGSDTLSYNGNRGHAHTSGSITVGAGGLRTTLTLVFWENFGGDSVELSVASGIQTFNGNFRLLSDGVFPGWEVKTTSSTPPPDFDPLIGLNLETQMLARNASAYIRIPLREVLDPNEFDSLRLRIRYDDGFIAYLNGTKIAERNPPSSVMYNASASAEHPDEQALIYEDILIALPAGLLKKGVGNNVLAIQGLNVDRKDGDLLIYPELQGLRTLQQAQRYFTNPTPGKANDSSSLAEVVADTKFSHDRGFYSAPFDLKITTATAGAEIRYTVDGSAPTATTGIVYNPNDPDPVKRTIRIDKTTTIRAAAFKPGAIATDADTQTYIFIGDVIRQSADGSAPAPGWPAGGSRVNSQIIDYGMDPDIVNSPTYSGQIEAALKSIPSFSLVMDLKDLFDPGSGFYVNPYGDGLAWERASSLELIYPDGTKGFQSNAGVRIRGGFSRSPDNPKHALRFFFRDEYGDGKLNYPVFGSDAAQSFDSFDLRTFQNYSWSFLGDPSGIFMRDQSSRDLQLAMGQPGERGDYFHLYINGQYWGLYNTAERPEADYSASYFGGTADDYDVIKPSPDTGYTVYATDGDMVAWTDLWNQLRGDMSQLTNYMRVQGLNPDGTRNAAYPVLLDVDNLIDYMLVIFYGGNLDAPLSNFIGNTNPNNFFASRNRNGQDGWKFYVHDAEHTLLNVWEDRTGPFNTIDPNPGTALARSNPQYMFQLLAGMPGVGVAGSPEFRLRVADRIQKWFYNNGVLTPGKVTEALDRRTNEIRQAVIGESARWGDSKRPASPLTQADWQNQVNNVRNNYVPARSGIVFSQLQADALYPSTGAPVFSQFGGVIGSTFSLTMSNPNPTGKIYYTLNGSDPRRFGGTVAGLEYTGPITLSGTTTVKARVLDAGKWSALTEAVFQHDLSTLKITEMMYNPAPPGSGPLGAQEFEFIELMNTGTTTLDLTGVTLGGVDPDNAASTVSYNFPHGASLAAGARTVLIRNAAAFAQRYPGKASGGVYTGKLDNGKMRITLSGPRGELHEFTYDDDWYQITDGEGFSLVAVNTSGDYNSKANWRPSNNADGKPGEDDPGLAPESIVINEVMSHTDLPAGDWIELHNTSSTRVNLRGWFLSDSDLDLAKYTISPSADLWIEASGYVVFTQRDHFGSQFGISELGDDVLLSSFDPMSPGNPGGYRDEVDFGAGANETSFGRYIKSTGGTDFIALSAPTLGGANALPMVGPVTITEIMYSPVAGGAQFIELTNLTGAALPLYDPLRPANTWKFTEGILYTFPLNTTLAPFGYALLVGPGTDPAAFRTAHSVPAGVPIFGPWSQVLGVDDNLKLERPGVPEPDGLVPYILSDQVHYDDKFPWPTEPKGTGPSLARRLPSLYGNDAGNWTAGPPGGTPGRSFLPPAAPSELTAIGVNQSLIRLNWLDNSVGEDGFRIERSSNGVTFTQIGSVGAGIRTFDDSGLPAGTFFVYRVRAYNGAGTSDYSNTFSVSTQLASTTTLIRSTDSWRYDESRTTTRADGTPPSWIGVGYNDGAAPWKSGNGIFGYDTDLPAGTFATTLNRGPDNDRTRTFYFRKHFNLPVNPSAVADLQIRFFVDDGVAVYLNGNARPYLWGIDEGTINYSTGTNQVIGDASWTQWFSVPDWFRGYLLGGDNVIAAEAHQVNITSSDIVFAIELQAVVTSQMVTADIIDAPDPSPTPPDTMSIRFNEAVTGFDLADLRLTREGGGTADLLTSAQSLTSSDGITWTLGNLASAITLPGRYTLKLAANGSGIAGVSGGILGADAIDSFKTTSMTLVGSPGDDVYHVRSTGGNLEIFTSIPPGFLPAWTFPLVDITSLSINGGGGNDTVELAGSLPFAVPFIGGPGMDRLIVDAATLTFAEDVSSALGIEQLVAKRDAIFTFTASQNLDSLELRDLAIATLAAGGNRLLRTANLSLAGSAVLNLNDNDLVVTNGTLSQIEAWVASARNGGNWQGIGITSATAKTKVLTGLAVAINNVGGGRLWPAESPTAVMVKYTYQGDMNLDGVVNALDYFRIDSGFLAGAKGYGDGDLNFDGVVNALDYFLIDSAFLGQGAPLSAPLMAAAAEGPAQTNRRPHVFNAKRRIKPRHNTDRGRRRRLGRA